MFKKYLYNVSPQHFCWGPPFLLPLSVSRFIAGIWVFRPPMPPGRRYYCYCCYVAPALTKGYVGNSFSGRRLSLHSNMFLFPNRNIGHWDQKYVAAKNWPYLTQKAPKPIIFSGICSILPLHYDAGVKHNLAHFFWTFPCDLGFAAYDLFDQKGPCGSTTWTA